MYPAFTERTTLYTSGNQQLEIRNHYTNYDPNTGHGNPNGAEYSCYGCGAKDSSKSQLSNERDAWAHAGLCHR